LLTVRLPGLGTAVTRPRIVVDGRLRVTLGSRLVLSAKEVPLWIVTQRGHSHGRLDAYRNLGVEMIEVPAAELSGVDIVATSKALAERGLTRVLVEGGGSLAASLLKADLIDRIAWFRAPTVMGGDGLPAVAGLGLTRLDALAPFVRHSTRTYGADTFELLVRAR
jgi:diaminohydroxyphosphoribosylaminopyrimidine deaminase/5-amino-6-(5-phosphoribosylamino)uracil reductase